MHVFINVISMIFTTTWISPFHIFILLKAIFNLDSNLLKCYLFPRFILCYIEVLVRMFFEMFCFYSAYTLQLLLYYSLPNTVGKTWLLSLWSCWCKFRSYMWFFEKVWYSGIPSLLSYSLFMPHFILNLWK
jgi:hypothetical protein